MNTEKQQFIFYMKNKDYINAAKVLYDSIKLDNVPSHLQSLIKANNEFYKESDILKISTDLKEEAEKIFQSKKKHIKDMISILHTKLKMLKSTNHHIRKSATIKYLKLINNKLKDYEEPFFDDIYGSSSKNFQSQIDDVIKTIPKQNQHKVSQIYLKQFGYLHNQQWKISVHFRGERFTRQKSIESFLSENNIFNILSTDPKIAHIFEDLNTALENGYPLIINELDSKGELGEKSQAYLLQLIANFISRSDSFREYVVETLESDERLNLLKLLSGSFPKIVEEYKDAPTHEIINRVLLFFMDYHIKRVGYFEIVILEAQDGKGWFTSDIPVVCDFVNMNNEVIGFDSELYFPLSTKYLAYLYHKDSTNRTNPLKTLESNKVHQITDEIMDRITKKIIDNSNKCILCYGYFNYKAEKSEQQ